MALKDLLELGYKERFKKHALILEEGNSVDDLYYIESGLLRVFYLKDGKEITDWFGTRGTFLTSISGFYNHTKSKQFIETVEDSVIYSINREKIEDACSKNSSLEKEYRQIIINHLLRLQQRISALQFYTASERYNLLLQKNPYVVMRASRTNIASYLGISLETLSRIRKT